MIQGLIYKYLPRGRFRPRYYQTLFSAFIIFINNLDDDVVGRLITLANGLGLLPSLVDGRIRIYKYLNEPNLTKRNM